MAPGLIRKRQALESMSRKRVGFAEFPPKSSRLNSGMNLPKSSPTFGLSGWALIKANVHGKMTGSLAVFGPQLEMAETG